MATAPAAAPNALIAALRAGTPVLPAGSASTYSFLPNMAPTYGPLPIRAPRGPALLPVEPSPAPPSPTPAPVTPPPVTPAPPPPSNPPPPVFVPPVTPLPRIDVVPDDGFVGPMPDDFVGPMPDDFVGPMPDDFVGPMPDDFVGPMPDDFVGPMPEDIQDDRRPSITVVEDLDVTNDPAPPTDPADDFELDRELGLVQQSDVFNNDFVGPMPEDDVAQTSPVTQQSTIQATDLPRLDEFEPVELPSFLNPVSTRDALTPSVTVNEVDVTDTPAPYTDPAEDFDIDRELGIVQQSDVFMGPSMAGASDNNTAQPSIDLSWFADQPITQLGTPLEESSSWFNPVVEPDLSVGLPAAVPAPAASEPLTEQDLMEMALFELLSQQLLTRGAPGMTDEETVDR